MITKLDQPPPSSPVLCPTTSSKFSTTSGDHHSELTDSTTDEDDENFISLLQYRDAYHILNLVAPHPSVNGTTDLSPDTIQDAYDAAKEEALVALEQFEATADNNSGGGQRNMFSVGQQNYLELKLQALDQAYEELMPLEELLDREGECEGSQQQQQEEDDRLEVEQVSASASSKKSLKAEEAPPPQSSGRAKYVWNEGSEGATNNAAIHSKHSPKHQQQQHQEQLHKREPSEDELDTIDIYFRPTPTKNKESQQQQQQQRDTIAKSAYASVTPSDVSSCTWDGSSIFSMISQTKKNLLEGDDGGSEGGLDDVLGPNETVVGASSAGLDDVLGPKETIAATSAGGAVQNQGKGINPNNHPSSSRRPPSGINTKHANNNASGNNNNNDKQQSRRSSPQAQISPKSITDFPHASIHNDRHYDNSEPYNRSGKAVVASRGNRIKVGSRAGNSGTNHATPPSTAAAHHGRATAPASAAHNHGNSHEATEAARMGILRALSEDNSECLPFDDDYSNYRNPYLNNKLKNETAHRGGSQERYSQREEERNNNGASGNGSGNNNGGGGGGKHYFQGKSDRMPKESNSLMASVMNTGQTHYERSTSDRSSPTNTSSNSHHERGMSGTAAAANTVPPSDGMYDNRAILPNKSMTSSTSSRRNHHQQQQQRSNNKSKNNPSSRSSSPTAPRSNNNSTKNNSDNYYGADDLLQSSAGQYDSLLQTGMELADELCMALNTCFKGGLGSVVGGGSSSSGGGGYDRGDSDLSFAKKLSRAGLAASAAFDAAASEFQLDDRESHLGEESTILTYDDGDQSQSVYTTDTGNDQSTAFNTMSSFRNRRGSEDDSLKDGWRKGGKVNSTRVSGRSFCPNPTVSSDPPPRMLV
eukprot:CAMPEP_0172309458 /NCGR_PEP_ID=MMETSP1058-20130122/9736_1 /TAXON_ID=83371 /ORGANISM="Detonula confervacea, Strain CCMP 353" /LENGTH=872 /DNA_ID=CAMNT_0013022085 /DNA_START=22 /DNA_END=2640 /DNA_ORIENTATION=-